MKPRRAGRVTIQIPQYFEAAGARKGRFCDQYLDLCIIGWDFSVSLHCST